MVPCDILCKSTCLASVYTLECLRRIGIVVASTLFWWCKHRISKSTMIHQTSVVIRTCDSEKSGNDTRPTCGRSRLMPFEVRARGVCLGSSFCPQRTFGFSNRGCCFAVALVLATRLGCSLRSLRLAAVFPDAHSSAPFKDRDAVGCYGARDIVGSPVFRNSMNSERRAVTI